MTKTFYSDWSTTAASNTVCDGANVAENCPMPGINNAIRSTMAAVKGALTPVAASTADSGLTYTATLAPVPDALVAGMVVRVQVATANSSTAPTLNLNGLGAFNLLQQDGATALLVGQFAGICDVEYDGTNGRVLNPFSLNQAPDVIGQIPGTATNDSASAGNVGQFISQDVPAGSAVALTTVTAANIASISLTAGDWDVWGAIGSNPAAGTVLGTILGAISTVSATLPTPANGGAYMQISVQQTGSAANGNWPVGTMRLSLSATITVYLVAEASFSVSTCSVYGFIGARRRR